MGFSPMHSSTRDLQRGEYQDIELNSRYASHGDSSHDEPVYMPPASPPTEPNSKVEDPKAHFQSAQPPVRHWPVHSQRVAAVTPLRAFMIVFDALLASTPIMFITLALVAARLDGEEETNYGRQLQQTLLLSPTIFPVIFAALMGRCFKYFGLYLAERGTTLGRLEQLVGCQSLFSALERQISLRSWSIVGLLLTFVWLLSPLGGQSALRLLDHEVPKNQSTDTFHYMNPNAMQNSFLMGPSAINSGRSTYTSLFLAALLSSTKYQNTPMDLWGNVKMPAYRSVADTSSDEWKLVNQNNNVTYTSLIGIPVAGVRRLGESTFNIRARQYDITCDTNEEMSFTDADYGNITATWKLNYTTPTGMCNEYPCPMSLKSLDKNNNVSVASCAISFEYLEAAIYCNATECSVKSVRKLDLISDGYTSGDDDFTRGNLIRNQFISFPTVDTIAVTDAGARGSTNMEKWIADPLNFIGVAYDNVDLYELAPDVLAERLTILWNTFFQSTYATTALGGNIPQNLSSLSGGSDNAGTSPFLTFNETTASLSSNTAPIYKINWRWFTALLISSLLLQFAAYAGLVLKYITLAPDIIGYASSFATLNPYVPTPTGGTTLSGLERAALLHDLPVRIGDVCAGEPVGAIAFAKADEGRIGRLDRGRWYI